MSALTSRDVAAAAVAESARKGYLDGQALAGRVHLAAPERPRVELRRQQLPARQGAAGVRHPVLEPGHGPPRGRSAPGLHPHRAGQLVRAARARSRSSASRSTWAPSTSTRTSWRDQRSHRALGERVQGRAAVRGQHAVRALEERSHPGAGQPAESGQPLELPRRRRAAGDARGVRRAGAAAAGQLVAGLGRVARRALRRD